MAEYVLLRCDVGSRAATVLCPKCGRISRQMLLLPYYHETEARLNRSHTCPICGDVYSSCSSRLAKAWSAAYSRYNTNADQYNQTVKDTYSKTLSQPSSSITGSIQSGNKQYLASDSDWQLLFSSEILKRGKSYQRGQRVNITVRSDNMVSGIVQGSELYKVQIEFNHGIVKDMRCSCPYATNGLNCKHEAAMLYELSEELSSSTDVSKTTAQGRVVSAFQQIVDARAKEKKDETSPVTQNQAHPSVTETAEQVIPKQNLSSKNTERATILSTETKTELAGTAMHASEELDKKIEYWKRELLDTGKRNKMINYRETKRATLSIVEPEASELFNKLTSSEKPLTFQKPINKDTDLRTYSMIALMETLSYTLNVQVGDIKTAGTIIEREKTLKNLRSKAKLAQEEQGTNILYLCFGFIYWREHDRESSPWFKAPLLMMPVTIGLKSLNAPYTLSRYDDEIEVNPTLDYLFNTEYNIDLPTFELKNKQSFDEYISQIEEIVDKRGWKVVREVSLGLLSFLKISMYHDLNDHYNLMANHPVLRAMSGDSSAIGDLPEVANHFDFDKLKPNEWHEVVDADSSQEDAILLSKLGVSFVMQGPPGTGKSQTITNIIAEALADGKKVLFVSEKAAALEVVLKRLTEVQLDDFCLSLHNYKANKKEIIDSIGANLNIEPEFVDRGVLNELTELFHDREFLTKYASDLHRIIEPLGESVYMVFGKIAKLESATSVLFHFNDIRATSREQYSSLRYVVDAFEKALRNLGGTLDSNVWHGTNAKSSGQTFKQQLVNETANLSTKLRVINQKAEAINSDFQTSIGHDWDSIEESLVDIDSALALPLFPSWWLDSGKRAALLNSIRKEMDVQRSFYDAKELFISAFKESILDASLNDWNARAQDILDSYKAIDYGTDNTGDNYLSAACQNYDSLKGLETDLYNCAKLQSSVIDKLGLEWDDSVEGVNKTLALLELILRKPCSVERVWLDSKKNEDGITLANAAQEHAFILNRARTGLKDVWKEEVLEADLVSARKAFLEEDAQLFHDSDDSTSIAAQLQSHAENAFDFAEKANQLVATYNRAINVFGAQWKDSFVGLQSAAHFLKLVSGATYLETDWFNAKKNETVQPLLSEANNHYKKIKEITSQVLQKWEPEALDMEDEAFAMLGRFKTEHVGMLHRIKAGYKEDIKRIRLLSKEVGKSVDESEAIAFLQLLKELRDEKKWFSENQEVLKELAGSYYRGTNTDWEAVANGMALATAIAETFSYSNIPADVILAIQEASSSIQRSAEVNELAAGLSESRITECKMALSKVSCFEYNEADSSLQKELLPKVQKRQEHYLMLKNTIESLQSNHKSSEEITLREVVKLFDDANQIQIEEAWFRENGDRFRDLFASRNSGEKSDFDEIRTGLLFGKEVNQLLSGRIPEKLADVFCKDQEEVISDFEYQVLGEIAMLSQRIQLLASFAYSDTQSISGSIIPKVASWLNTTDRLKDLFSEMKSFFVSDEVTLEQAIISLPFAISAKSQRDQIISQEKELAKQLGDRYQGITTDWAAIKTDVTAVSDYLSKGRTAVTADFLELVCDSKELRDEANVAINALRFARDDTTAQFTAFAKYFDPAQRFERIDLLALSDRYDKCIDGFGELNKWLDYVEAKEECDSKGLASFTAAIADRNNTVEDVCNAFERGFCLQWLSSIIDDVPAVQSFRRRVHEQRSERFIKLDAKQYEIARKTIRKRIIDTYPSLNRVAKAGSELGILRHEMEKKRRIMPLRKLFQSIPTLLLTLKPCLMMSPLSVAYFLDAEKYQFDMVIFDEASQIFPQDAIGAIFRAKQVIIAGDTKQLPPTNFFAASTSNSSEGYDDDEGYENEVYDSILEETANVLPNRTLLWHYRSKHEHLIAFSNQEIYKNDLVTFPSSNESDPDTGVEFVYVEDGYYEPSPRNYNILEARRIVELIKEHIEKHPDRSLGVIAFSEKQQQAIALEIQRFREKHSEYEAFFAEGKEEEFFVKNLENVQGDERDTIFFSVGYAKTREQKANNRPMSMRFGPLGISGGERRLNVAITRAKVNVKLVSSILPSDIDLSRTESEGIRMLRSYIEFAMNGESTLAAAHRNSRPDDFVDSIAKFIQSQGFKVKQYVGCSGYRIDIAVEHPSNLIEQFVAGVECDGFSYASAKTSRDRDRLRSSVLKNMGWNMYRVWSAEWYKNPEVEGQKLIAFLKGAVSSCDEKIRVLEEQKRKEEEAKRLELEKARAAREAEERKKQLELEAKEAKLKAAREEAERKRHAEEERRRTEREAARKREEERRKAEELRLKEAEIKRQQADLSWVKPGARVLHNRFGEGAVVGIEDGTITVRFGQTEKMFQYPSVFEKGILTKPFKSQQVVETKDVSWAQIGVPVMHKSFGKGVIENVSRSQILVRFGETIRPFLYPKEILQGNLYKTSEPASPQPVHYQMSLLGDRRKEFVVYMVNTGYAENTANSMASSVSKVSDYAIKKGYSKTSFFEMTSYSDVNTIWSKVEKDHGFVELNRSQHNRFSIGMQHYINFLKKTNVQDKGNASKKSNALALIETLVREGFTCIDNRATSSILWVLYDVNKKPAFERILASYKIQYKLEMRGSLATNSKAAWRIMI